MTNVGPADLLMARSLGTRYQAVIGRDFDGLAVSRNSSPQLRINGCAWLPFNGENSSTIPNRACIQPFSTEKYQTTIRFPYQGLRCNGCAYVSTCRVLCGVAANILLSLVASKEIHTLHSLCSAALVTSSHQIRLLPHQTLQPLTAKAKFPSPCTTGTKWKPAVNILLSFVAS